MEDDQQHLGQEAGNQDTKHDLNGNSEFLMKTAQSVIKRETGNTAQQQRDRIDEVGDKVEQLRQQHRIVVKDVLDVRKVASGTQSDQLDTKDDKCNEACLNAKH